MFDYEGGPSRAWSYDPLIMSGRSNPFWDSTGWYWLTLVIIYTFYFPLVDTGCRKTWRISEGTEKVPSEITGKKNSHKFQMNVLRIAYLRKRVWYSSNIAWKRACTIVFVQALNFTLVFQWPRYSCRAFLMVVGIPIKKSLPPILQAGWIERC